MDIKLENHLCFKLYLASRLIIQGYGERLAHLGITYPKYLVLLAHNDGGEHTVSEIGSKLGLDSGTLSPLLKSLAHDGLIQRRRLDDDERIVVSKLSKAGSQKRDEAKVIAMELFANTGLSEDQFWQLHVHMDDFVERCRTILNQKQPSSKKFNKTRKTTTQLQN